MRVTLKQQTKEHRIIFDLLNEKPRIQYNEVAEIFGVDIRTASGRLKDAIERGIIVGPQIRKKSFSNFRTYLYLSRCEDPIELFEQYTRNSNVLYHAIADGSFNFHAISKEKLDIEDTILQGIPSDYYISYPPDRPWGIAIDAMRDMVNEFNPETYVPKGYITNHWDETVEWSRTDEILYQEFKYNLRKPLEPLVKDKYHIWSGDGYDFLNRLPQCCTISTCYFPETVLAYDPYLFMFKTEYEDFIIDLFSQLPTTCWFRKVSDTLLAYIWTWTRPIDRSTAHVTDISELHIPFLVRDLIRQGIVKEEAHAEIECYWRKEVNDI
ncbi:MAG: winged helix-turn-helix domain-containing protein [Theionarchaea archaeon]|nr:winged helix-turn-helix domain-containing protein [Theionarchaea archaeon]